MPAFDRRRTVGETIWTIPGFLAPEECRAMIERYEATGFEEATINGGGGMVMNKRVRNNDRLMVDDPEMAARFFERARPHVPAQIVEPYDGARTWRACGLNERFRIYRYHPGQRFRPHFDGAFARSEDEESALTFMIYLNDDFHGGETAFHDYETVVRPETGTALLFFHPILHEGREVTRGTKYALRSDVMYRAV